MIKVISDIQELQKYRDEWNVVFDRCKYSTPFQSYDFTTASYKYLKWHVSSPYIILVLDDRTKSIKAILPTCLTNKGVLEFINQGYLDFCSIIVDPLFDNYSMYEEIGNFINADKNIKKIDFMNLKSDSPIISSLKPFLNNSFVNDCSYYSLLNIYPQKEDVDFIDSYRSLNSKKKKNLRTQFKNLKNGSSYKIFNIDSGDAYPKEIVDELVKSMIDSRIRDENYFSGQMLSFWEELYNYGILSMVVLYVNEDVKSCNLIYDDKKHREIIKWIMLYKDNKWNKMINILLSELLYNQGGYTINYARGIYDYKLVNFHPDVQVLFRVRIYKKIIPLLIDHFIDYLRLIKRNLLP